MFAECIFFSFQPGGAPPARPLEPHPRSQFPPASADVFTWQPRPAKLRCANVRMCLFALLAHVQVEERKRTNIQTYV